MPREGRRAQPSLATERPVHRPYFSLAIATVWTVNAAPADTSGTPAMLNNRDGVRMPLRQRPCTRAKDLLVEPLLSRRRRAYRD